MIEVGDARMLQYFWEYKRDLTCYVDWPRLEAQLKQEHPGLLLAVQLWHRYENRITTQINEILEEAEEREEATS